MLHLVKLFVPASQFNNNTWFLKKKYVGVYVREQNSEIWTQWSQETRQDTLAMFETVHSFTHTIPYTVFIM